MFNKKLTLELDTVKKELSDTIDFVASLKNNMPTISFTTEGIITEASDLFLQTVGYSLDQVKGKHHRMFCDESYTETAEYKQFWEGLSNGDATSGTFLRKNKAGENLWLEATYFPITHNGKVMSIFKIASNVTKAKIASDEQTAIYQGIDRSMGIIEFTPQGEVVSANSNFLAVIDYSLNDIKGKHHRMFCTAEFYEDNPDFWAELAQGQFKSGRYQRVGKKGEEIWLEATYNPIFDDGKVIKVIKFASDTTESVKKELAITAATQLAHSTSIEMADKAVQGKTVLQKTVTVAQEINEELSNASDLIGKLNHQSDEISKIVTTISSIADQTNLLALNAAIEAARAGEHGRGFAVVADEVRTLASRTSESTVEIEDMVKQNTALSREAKTGMEHVQTQSLRSQELVNESFEVIDAIEESASNVSSSVAGLL